MVTMDCLKKGLCGHGTTRESSCTYADTDTCQIGSLCMVADRSVYMTMIPCFS
jgi:hypothetical protein